MERLHESLTIEAPASQCYEKWTHFEEFPHFMTHVEAVWPMASKQWHWVFKGALGTDVRLDMEVEQNDHSRSMNWRTLTGEKNKAEGSVHFEEMDPRTTRMICNIHYELPAGPLGEAIAHLLLNPQKTLKEELENFKHLVEGTNVPSAKVHVGKTLQADPFVVPSETGTRDFGFTEKDESGYAGPYGLDNDVSDAILSESGTETPEEVKALQDIQHEENPYLADEGALHSEDLRDMQAFVVQAFVVNEEEVDVFTESYDTPLEDLESYTEDLDEEVDSSPNAFPNTERETP